MFSTASQIKELQKAQNIAGKAAPVMTKLFIGEHLCFNGQFYCNINFLNTNISIYANYCTKSLNQHFQS